MSSRPFSLSVNRVRNCIELVGLTEDWPLLREDKRNLIVAVHEKRRDIDDVLNNPGFLVISLLDEERVVLNSFGWRLDCEQGDER